MKAINYANDDGVMTDLQFPVVWTNTVEKFNKSFAAEYQGWTFRQDYEHMLGRVCMLSGLLQEAQFTPDSYTIRWLMTTRQRVLELEDPISYLKAHPGVGLVWDAKREMFELASREEN